MTNLKEKYEVHFLRNDFIVTSLLFGLVLFVLRLFKINLYVLVSNKDSFYSALLTISATLFGFLIAGITLLISLLDDEKLKILKDTPQPKNMLDTFFSAIRVSAIESIAILFTHINITYDKEIFYIVVFMFIIMCIRVFRVIWILYNLSYILILSNK